MIETIIPIAISTIAVVIAFFTFKDKRKSDCKNDINNRFSDINNNIDEIKKEIDQMKIDINDLKTKTATLDEKVRGEVRITGILFGKLEKKLDNIEEIIRGW